MFSRLLFLSVVALTFSEEKGFVEERLKLDAGPDGVQYFLYDAKTTWAEGMNYCASEGAQMAVVDTPEQAARLKELISKLTRVSSVHVGFHDQFVESQYVTIEDKDVNVDNWAPTFPTNNVANNCGGFNENGMMDIACTTSQETFCQLRSLSSYSPITPHGLYNLHVERRGWQAAWEICHYEGGHLWVVDSLAEAVAVSTAFEHITDFWVGVHRRNGEDAFINVHGKPLNTTGFTRWETGFPFGSAETRPYIALKGNNGEPTLWTNTFSGTLPFICEHAA